MPGRTETALYESGRATAPPGVQYTSLTGATSEGYTHTVASTSTTNLTPPIQSPRYTPNYSNYVQQRPQASPRYAPNYSPCPSPSPNPNYQAAISKPNPSPSSSSIPSQSPQYTPSYSSSSHLYSPTFASSSNFPNFNNNNFDLPSTSTTNTTKTQQSYNENNIFPSAEHLSSTLFNIPKTTKSNPGASPRYTPNYSNFSYFSNNQPKYTQGKPDNNGEGAAKQKNEFEVPQKPQKQFKDESEFNYNIGDLHQFLSKHGSKIKNSSSDSSAQDLVTDSLLNFLQRKTYDKNVHENFPFDSADINQVVVSICNKNKSEENKKEGIAEDPKLMNDLLSKVLEKEDKRFDRKKNLRKEILDDLNLESEEKKIKRDAMSHYQDDKSHHKRNPNYGDFNQWDFLNQQDLQTGNNNRRGHIPFCGTSQSHSMAWNPMGMGMPHQSNPYYSNPRGHVMPAHAHTEYRYNQWNNPNHKNVTNIQNAHSQNLPQNKLDVKHHNVQKPLNPSQEFGLPMNTPEYSKIRTSPHDMALRAQDLPARTAHPEYPPSISPALKNPPSLRTPPPIPGHPKNIISNPLSDLQMLVTNQENDKPLEKDENYQQETVDLSAHSDAKLKETPNREEKPAKSPSAPQTNDKSELDDVCEKPVELTAKNTEKSENSAEKEISSSNNPESLAQNKNCENDKNANKTPEGKEEPPKPEKPPTPKPEEKDIRKSDEDDEIARELALLDGSETKKLEKEPEKPKESEESVLTKLRSRRKSSNEVPASSSNEEIPDNNNKTPKRKSDEKPESEISKKAFMEVESELEKMFEGVDEGGAEENSDLPTVSSTSTDVKPSTSDNSKKTPRKKPPRNARSSRLSSGQSSSSENQSHKKKKKLGSKDDVKKKVKKNLCDVIDSSRRGPVLHVEGSRDCPTSVIVVNYPKGDDEDEKDKSMAKKQAINSSRIKHHNELDYRGRSRNGLFSSTLSARYDAHTTDYSWICVFCKRGPHYNALGDLFGPYIITKDENNSLCDFSGDEKDISNAQKRGGRNKKSIRSNNMVDHFQKMSKKLKRHHSGESSLTGMTLVSDDQVDELRYEVWVHEQCAVWSPNVCLIGSRIVGMQEAIWSSVKTMCSKCGEMGANLGCVHRNCPNRSHYDCARQAGWSLEQETFISICHIHKPRS